MKHRFTNHFTHQCRSCHRRWFTNNHEARCPNCGSAKRDTFKLVPYQPEGRLRRELLVYLGLMVLAIIITWLLR